MARAFVLIVALGALGAPGAARADDYYVTVFTAESVPYRPTSTHAFAGLVRVPTGGPAEVDAICWGPASMKIRGITLRGEDGVNMTVPATLDWSLSGLEKPRPAAEWAAMGVAARQGDLAGGLPAALLLPVGREGPAFLAYPNLPLLTEWNQSLTYVLTAAYFATRIAGAERYLAGEPDPALPGEEVQLLQERLRTRGHDVGEADGILGARSRVAVQAEQVRLRLPADAWPTRELLDALAPRGGG